MKRKRAGKSKKTENGVGKKTSKRSKVNETKDSLADVSEQEDSTEYEVQAVIDYKRIDGVKHYLIRWKGYTADSDTWEPESTLTCKELIKAFKQKGSEKKKSTPSNNKKKKTNEEESWDENEQFEVDRILDVYFHRNGTRDFLVSWKGYPSSYNSWEPEEHMDCKDLIEKYMAKVEGKEGKLRVNRKPVNRLEFSMHAVSRRLSKRNTRKERVHYYDAE